MIELASEVAIEGVGEGGEDEDADCNPTEGFVGFVAFDTQAVVDGYCYEDGYQEQAKDGDVGGEGDGVVFLFWLIRVVLRCG